MLPCAGEKYGGHSHGGTAETPLFEGDSKTIGLNAVYKWAPDGNYRERNVKLQFEYFNRDDEGNLTLLGSSPLGRNRSTRINASAIAISRSAATCAPPNPGAKSAKKRVDSRMVMTTMAIP